MQIKNNLCFNKPFTIPDLSHVQYINNKIYYLLKSKHKIKYVHILLVLNFPDVVSRDRASIAAVKIKNIHDFCI